MSGKPGTAASKMLHHCEYVKMSGFEFFGVKRYAAVAA